MYVYVYLCMCIYLCIYVYLCVYVYVCLYVYLCIYVYLHTCNLSECMCVYMYVCMYVCMYGHTYSKSMDQPGEVANSAPGQLNRKNQHFPVRVRA